MKIDSELLKETGIDQAPQRVFDFLGLANATNPNSLSFIDDHRYVEEVNRNKNVTGIITSSTLFSEIDKSKEIFIVEDPRYSFYTLQNLLYLKSYIKSPTQIGKNVQIHPRAFVSEYNVVIGDNVVLEPNVTILSDVIIGNNVIVRAGSVIGAEGFEHKRTSKGILPVMHDGKVIIGDNVHIGACNAISKGFAYRDTIIGKDSKTDNLVHIAHCVQIGERCLFPASCMIAGSVTIEDDVWIGPNASISSQIKIKSNAYITIGSVVTKDVEENERLTGNFAIPHQQFLKVLKSNLKLSL